MDKAKFTEALANERKRRGFTQKQLAQALGVSDRTYSKWETGENEMDVATLCRLAEFYGESPALFFANGGSGDSAVRAELAALPPKEAADRWFALHYEALRGMADSAAKEQERDPSTQMHPVPWADIPRDPSEESGNFSHTSAFFSSPGLMAVFAAGDDLNLSLLLEPNRQNYAWIREEAELLRAVFRVLAMPGALPCLYFLMHYDLSDRFTLPYLAEQAGVSEAEAAAFLEAAVPLGLGAFSVTILRAGAEEHLYTGYFREALLGMISLAKLLVWDDAFRSRYALMTGTRSRIAEKGEEK